MSISTTTDNHPNDADENSDKIVEAIAKAFDCAPFERLAENYTVYAKSDLIRMKSARNKAKRALDALRIAGFVVNPSDANQQKSP